MNITVIKQHNKIVGTVSTYEVSFTEHLLSVIERFIKRIPHEMGYADIILVDENGVELDYDIIVV